MSCTSMTLHLRSRSYGMVLLAFFVLSSCTGILNTPQSTKQTTWSVKARKEIYSQSDIDLIYEKKPKDIKAYCILENSKNQDNCYWVNGDLPKKFISETGDGRKVLTVWVKNKKNVVSKPYSTPPFVVDSVPPVWTSAGFSHATPYASLSQSPPITYTQSAVDALTTVRYQYAIGSSNSVSNRADVKNWTDLNSNMPFQVSDLSLTNGSTYYVSMRAVDEANNISTVFTSTGWLASVTSVSDPSFVSITPPSPSSDSTPVIVGTVGTDVQTVNLYSNAACTVSLGSGTSADFVGAGITLTMPLNPGTATTIYGQGEDSNSDLSNCVLLTSYRHDSVGPSVARVYSNTAAGFYNDGDILDIRVEFSEAVTVVGIPTIELETGGTDAVVNYVSQPATNTLLFSYTVASGHESADLNYVATTSLTVGTSIKDAAGNDATLTLPGLATGNSLAGQEALVIDAVVPAAPSIVLSSPASSPGTDSTPTFEVALTGGGNFSATDVITLHEGADCSGSAVGTLTTQTGTSALVTRGSAMAQTTTDFRVKVTDAAGNASCSTSHATAGLRVATYQYDNTAPAAPSIVLNSPATSPGTDSTPTFEIALTGGVNFSATDTITLHEGADCSGGAVATLTSETGTSALITRGSAMSETTTDFRVKVTDEAGNASCSTAHATAGLRLATYRYDNTAPAWSDTLSHPATYGSTTQSPNIAFTANATDTGGSGIQKYQYSIGTSAGGTETLGWTDLAGGATPTSPFQVTGLTLSGGNTYHINMRVMDNVGLTSTVYSSDWTVTAASVPTLSYAGATGTVGIVGRAMSVSPTSIDDTGSAITNCAATPALPAWASINTTTCVISGTPNAALVATEYSIVATNGVGDSTAATVTLRADPLPTGAITIAAGATHTTVNPVLLDLVGNYATEMYVTNTTDCSAGGTWESLVTGKTWTLGQTNATATVAVKYRNSFGDVSACYTDTIVHDDDAPTAPSFVSFDPASPGATNTPKVIGTSPADTTYVLVYKDSTCLTKIGSGTKTDFEGAGVTFSVLSGVTTNIYSVTIDAAGNRSACTSMGVYQNNGAQSSDSWELSYFTNDDAPIKRMEHTAVWTGSKMIVWGGSAQEWYDVYKSGGIYDPQTDSWKETSLVNAPGPRTGHTAVWTGSKMIIWGGEFSYTSYYSDGGIYDPVTDSWSVMSNTNAQGTRAYHAAVWTGTRMIIWGGKSSGAGAKMNTSSSYDPNTDTWTILSNTSAPTAETNADAVWTGSKVFLWAGTAAKSRIYDPNTDTWTNISATNAPSGGYGGNTVWTGSKIIMWGGDAAGSGIYDPVTNTWAAMSSTGAPSDRWGHKVIWTGSKLFVWGAEWDVAPNIGGVYDPATDSWTLTTTTGAPDADHSYGVSVVWTGSKALVWGGGDDYDATNQGFLYDLNTDFWTPTKAGQTTILGSYGSSNGWTGWVDDQVLTVSASQGYIYDQTSTEELRSISTTGLPAYVSQGIGVWTGSKLFVWGGTGSNYVNTGAVYDPLTDSWTSVSTTNAPTARSAPHILWTGSTVVVWGGTVAASTYTNTGGLYDPALDTWVTMSTTNAPSARVGHSTVWTDSKLIVWGGAASGTRVNTGAVYDPALNTWVATSTTGAPTARTGHGAVWSGADMIVWGGYTGSYTNTGGRYNLAGNSWTATTTTGAPAGDYPTISLWTGSRMLVLKFSSDTISGGMYEPILNSWVTVPSSTVYASGSYRVWTGTDIIFWGGKEPGANAQDGKRFNVHANTWSNTSLVNAPSARTNHSMVWTGSKLIVSAGSDFPDGEPRDIGIYYPGPLVPAPSIALSSPAASPSNDSTPTFEVALTGGGNFDAGDVITLHEGSDCLGASVGSVTGETGATALITRSSGMTNGTSANFRVKVTNSAGIANCSVTHATSGLQLATYAYDNTPPAAPSIVLNSPASSPGTDATPTFQIALTGGGNFVATDIITLHEGADCSAAAVATLTSQTGATALITRGSDMSEVTTDFRVKVTDAASNATCSTSHATAGLRVATYFYDNTAPTWANSVSHAGTHNVASETPSISFTADASDGAGSGIQKYQYSIGTSSGGTQTRDWTDLAGGASPTSPYQATGLSLLASTTYYLNMRVLDNSGLSSTVHTSSWTVASVPTLSFAGATGTVSANGHAMTVTPTTLNDNGSAVTNCVATPALPAWASIDTTTCVISGTPNASLAITTYSVVASNANGASAAATVTLRVDPLPTGAISIAVGASRTSVNPVILNLVGNYATEMYVTNTADCSAGGTWATLSSIRAWTLAQTNATATVAVKYKNAFGDESACYTDTIVHDDTAPAAPAFVSFDPVSPSTSTTPKVIGTSPADTHILKVFKDSSCKLEIGKGTKAAFEGAGVTFDMLLEATRSIYAYTRDAAGNQSACTLMGTYVNNGTQSANSWQTTQMLNGETPPGRFMHSAVWTGTKMLVWGGWNAGWYGLMGSGAFYDPVTDSWSRMTSVGEPSGREIQGGGVWTGRKYIVWGGKGYSAVENTGALYDPVLDTWTAMSTINAPTARQEHSHIWTGSKYIVWGGRNATSTYYNSGGVYDPDTDTWTATSLTNAPSARAFAVSAWTGSKIILWGGFLGSSTYTNAGAIYDPNSDTWSTMSTTGAPSARYGAGMWTGSRLIVWGGYGGAYLGDGAIFDPITNSWSAMSSTGAPTARSDHTVAWTGSKMIVYGGYAPGKTNTGGIYDPATDSWTATSTTNAPPTWIGWGHTNVWTGSNMIVWGGENSGNDASAGGVYDPVADTWTPTKNDGVRSFSEDSIAVWAEDKLLYLGDYNGGSLQRVFSYHPTGPERFESRSTTGMPLYFSAYVWTGSKLIVWGGFTNGTTSNNGGVYDPVTDSWTATTTTGAPTARRDHRVVWTGSKMIAWGGHNGTSRVNTGGLYDPVLDSWSATTTTGAPTARLNHTAVWTGSVMMVWGGDLSTGDTNTGSRYDPVANTWTATTTTSAPTARNNAFGAWTGTRVLIYGGGNTNTGGRYDPVANSWSSVTTTGAPSGAFDNRNLWNGTELLVWKSNGSDVMVGGRYNPVANTWTSMSTTGASMARQNHTLVWTGSKMIVMGGRRYDRLEVTDIGIYAPSAKPAAPSIVLNSPASSPGSDSTPTFEIALTGGGNFAATDVITLHEDQYCTGTAVATLTGETGASALITRASAMTDEATATFRVKVTNSGGASSCSNEHATVGLRSAVYNYDTTPPPTISYAGATGTSGSRGTAMSITPTTLTAGAGATITNCAITAGGALPTGLSIDTGTCVISGTPTTLITSNAYTVTVTNSFALTADAGVTITVSDEWDDASDSSIGFAGGTKTGVAWSSSMLQLGSAGSCDATATNCAELTSSWAPQWASLQSYWKMNETSWNGTASEVLDAKGTNHGTAAGNATTTTSAKVGARAGTFDGTGDYVSAATMGGDMFSSAGPGTTLSAWINVSAFNGNWQAAINQGGNGAGFWYLGVNQDPGYENTWLGIPDGSIGCVLLTPVKPVLNTWAHVVMKHSGTSYAMYVNGEQVSSATCSGNGNTAALNFGYAAGVGEYFNGKVDEVAIWNTALSDDEIRLIYGRQSPSFSGHFVSRVFDAQSSISWDGVKWISSLPFGKELPGDADNSGTITSADSEVAADYSAIATDTLMDSLEGLWKLNGTLGIIADSATFSDFSGAGNSGTVYDADGSNTVKYGLGVLGEAMVFEGVSDYATIPIDLSGTNVITVSFWMKWDEYANNDDFAMEFTSDTNSNTGGFFIDPSSGNPASGFFQVCLKGNVNHNCGYFTRPSAGVWHHYAIVFDKGRASNEISAYVDGAEQSITFTANANNTNNFANSTLYLMSRGGTNLFGKGSLDELAIWSRELSEAEIVQVLRRGANRTKFQVRTCTTSNCSDAPAWEGPDGTPNTYFSEIHNNTTINAAGQATGRVNVNFMDLVFFDFSSVNLPTTQYFQYKAVLESDRLCDLDSDGAADDFCSPDVKSVEVVP